MEYEHDASTLKVKVQPKIQLKIVLFQTHENLVHIKNQIKIVLYIYI